MTSHADVSKVIKWYTGDGYRGVANATIPDITTGASSAGGIFHTAPTNGVTAMLALGAIKAGFNRTPKQDTTDEDAWNNESGAPYYEHYGNLTETIAFEALDLATKAVATTLLFGGSSTETAVSSGVFEQIEGNGETFSFLLQLRDIGGTKKQSLWIPNCGLSERPARQLGDRSNLASAPLSLKPLAPTGGGKAVRIFNNWDPLA